MSALFNGPISTRELDLFSEHTNFRGTCGVDKDGNLVLAYSLNRAPPRKRKADEVSIPCQESSSPMSAFARVYRHFKRGPPSIQPRSNLEGRQEVDTFREMRGPNNEMLVVSAQLLVPPTPSDSLPRSAPSPTVLEVHLVQAVGFPICKLRRAAGLLWRDGLLKGRTMDNGKSGLFLQLALPPGS